MWFDQRFMFDWNEIASRSLEDGKEKARVAHDHRERSVEFSPKYRRLPKCLPRSDTARRIQVCGTDFSEVDHVQSFAINTEPTKPHAVGNPVECLGCAINLELNPLYAAGIAKMIKIAEKILHFEPNNTLTGAVSAIVLLLGFLHTVTGADRAIS